MVTSIWEPCTLSNKCRRLNIYLMTCSLFRTIRVTRYSGLSENCPSIIMFPCHAAQRVLVSLPLSVLKRTYQCGFFFCSQETVATIMSMSITVRLDISVWQPSSVLQVLSPLYRSVCLLTAWLDSTAAFLASYGHRFFFKLLTFSSLFSQMRYFLFF